MLPTGNQTPNGEPTGTPPTLPPPQGLNEPEHGNVLAAPQASTAAISPALSEGQIARVTELANNSELERAKLAQTKAASVKQFAAMMIKHHSEAKIEQAKLYKQLGLTATQSQTATELAADSAKALGALRDADAASFDVSYIDDQIEAHQRLLDTIDRELMPAAKDQALVAGLKNMRTTVVAHLAEAKRVFAEINSPR